MTLRNGARVAAFLLSTLPRGGQRGVGAPTSGAPLISYRAHASSRTRPLSSRVNRPSGEPPGSWLHLPVFLSPGHGRQVQLRPWPVSVHLDRTGHSQPVCGTACGSVDQALPLKEPCSQSGTGTSQCHEPAAPADLWPVVPQRHGFGNSCNGLLVPKSLARNSQGQASGLFLSTPLPLSGASGQAPGLDAPWPSAGLASEGRPAGPWRTVLRVGWICRVVAVGRFIVRVPRQEGLSPLSQQMGGPGRSHFISPSLARPPRVCQSQHRHPGCLCFRARALPASVAQAAWCTVEG